jgi:hypothetical protein
MQTVLRLPMEMTQALEITDMEQTNASSILIVRH